MNETPADAARSAGLRYVSDTMPGLRRKRSGKHFAYVDAAGKTIRDEEVISRIRALAIPPAYEDVWICPAPNGHIQATGRDARGRSSIATTPAGVRFATTRNTGDMVDFASALPALRKRVDRDLRLAGMPAKRFWLRVVRLLETTTIRDRQRRIRTRQSLLRLNDVSKETRERPRRYGHVFVPRKKRNKTRHRLARQALS